MKHFLFEFFLLFFLAITLRAQDASSAQAPPQKSLSDLLVQGLQAYRTGKFDAAIESYQTALQHDPKSGEAYAGLARAYLKQEKVEAAYDTASKGVAEVPESLAAHTALGEVYFRQAKMGESEKEFLRTVNTTHPEARAYLGLARLYDALSFHARAKTMLEKAHALDPDDPDIQGRWLRTVSRSERIKLLQDYLAKPGNDDTDTRKRMQRSLSSLQEQEKVPQQSCKLVSELTATQTDLKVMMTDPKHLHGYGLEVKVNGQSGRLLLDTGASGLLINKKMAERAGIKPLTTTKIGGIGDSAETEGYVGYADSIKVGTLEFQNCLIEVSEKRSVLDDDGLIGADVFRDYLVVLDFPNQKLKLEELPKRPDEKEGTASLSTNSDNEEDSAATPEPHDPYVAPEMQSYTKIWRFGHFLLIPTTVADLAPKKMFLIDTGFPTSQISLEAAREVKRLYESNARIRGLSGSVKHVYTTSDIALEFGNLRKENDAITAFDLSKTSRYPGTEVSGILGITALGFTAMKIDYRDGLVYFDYDKSHWRGIPLTDFSKGSKP
ncbi:MAG TPA: aspartyl protease family protein [Terriglobales bacterium]|nr:aspartyl protease family protein [Terriglobales bacterium]